MASVGFELSADPEIPSSPGTYVLLLDCACSRRLIVGKLGRLEFRSGWYAYVGSAFGRGGLRARCSRHLRQTRRPRWHIDYFKEAASVRAVWFTNDPIPREHQWAGLIGRWADAATPIPHFGSSDCACPSHLFYFHRKPSIEKFRRSARRRWPDHASISAFILAASRQPPENAL
jgi:Uri superfamily endonuclease